jgi:hypothetical protein
VKRRELLHYLEHACAQCVVAFQSGRHEPAGPFRQASAELLCDACVGELAASEHNLRVVSHGLSQCVQLLGRRSGVEEQKPMVGPPFLGSHGAQRPVHEQP